MKKAFTLIELLVVISVIALLASVVLASLNTARDKARIASGKQFAAQVEHIAGEQAVGIWDFDECTASTTADRSSFGNNGSLINGATWSSDTPFSTGCSISFNGASSAVNVGTSASMRDVSLGSFTISAWVKSSDTSGRGCVFCNYSGGATIPQFNLELYLTGKMRYYHAGASGSDDYQSVNSELRDGKWHQVAMVRDGATGKGYIYTDGVQTLSFSYAATDGSVYATNNFYIGSDNRLNADITHNGLIDSVRLFSKALVASEVLELYTQGIDRSTYAYER